MPLYNPSAGGGGGYSTIQDEGVSLTQRTTIDFVGAGVTATDTGSKTQVSIPGGAGSSWTETEVDFGAGANIWDKNFTITDAGVTAASKVIIVPSGNTATGRAAGDTQWDNVTYSAVAGNGSFTVYAISATGPITGKRKVYYNIA